MSADIEALWDEHHEGITNYVKRRVLVREVAEDIVQETFVKAWSAIERGKGYSEHASGWLYRIAHNLIIDHYRANEKRRNELELDSFAYDSQEGRLGRAQSEILADKSPGPDEVVMSMMFEENVNRQMWRLTDGQATVLNMRLDGYAFEEIAETIDVTFNGTKALLHRAKVNLHEWLKEAA